MRYVLLILLLATMAAPGRAEEESPKKRIAAAVKRVDGILRDWRKARAEDRPLPVDALLEAMRNLGRIPCRAALEKVSGYLGHREVEVARCAVQGLMAPEDPTLLLVSGSLLAKRLTAKRYAPRRRDLFIDQVYALAATGYLGGFDQLKALLRKVQDGEVVALAAETLAHLKDHRAIGVLEDWASWDKGYDDRPGTIVDTGRRRDTAVGSKPVPPGLAGQPLPGTNRVASGSGAWPGPGEKWVRDAVFDAFFELIGREDRGFSSYEEYTAFMVNNREEHRRLARQAEVRAKKQEKRIRACP